MIGMRLSRRYIWIAIVLAALAASACSSKGVRMPKHRRTRHCNCPTFAESLPTPPSSAAYYEE